MRVVIYRLGETDIASAEFSDAWLTEALTSVDGTASKIKAKRSRAPGF